MKNYEADRGEKIIIICDNDGENKKTEKVILEAKKMLESRGAFVVLSKPESVGDYNDLLKYQGSSLIKKQIEVKIVEVERIEKIDLFLDKFINSNKEKMQEIKKIDPDFGLKKSLENKKDFNEKKLENLCLDKIEKKFLERSNEMLNSNRSLLKEKNLAKAGDIVLKEFDIRENLAKNCPQISGEISSKYGKPVQVQVNREQLQESVLRLNRYVLDQKSREEILRILKGKGIDFLVSQERRICQKALNAKVSEDLKILKQKDGIVKDFHGKEHIYKRNYVDSLLEDKEVKEMVKVREVYELMPHQTMELSLGKGI